MKLVRDHKKFTHRLPPCNPDRLRGLVHVHEVKETFTTESASASEPTFPVKHVATFVPVTAEIVADAVVYDVLDRAIARMAHYWTTSESVELNPDVTRDDAAVALWQAANELTAYERTVRELEEKIERMQATTQSMFGGTDTDDIAELLGIRTEY